MENESKIFDMYVGCDKIRPVFNTPFAQGEYVYASDGHILIRVMRCATNGSYNHSDKPGCSILFIETREELPITIQQLEKLISGVEKVEETKTVGEDIECKECEGFGVVEWEYEEWTKDFDCPACDGSGYSSESKKVPTGRMIPDPYAVIKLGCKTFMAEYIHTIAKTLEFLGINEIKMRYNSVSPHEQVVFNFSKEIDVLLMPYSQTK